MKLTILLFGLLFLCCQTANATILTLDGNDIRNTGAFVEGNYMISAPVNQVNGGNLTLPLHLITAGFSGDLMETWNTDAVFTFTTVNENLFDVLGLDVGSYFSTNAAIAAWTFRGFNGAAELFALVNNQSFGRIDLGWTGLTSFTIASSRGSAASSFDNLEFVKSESNISLAAFLTISEPTSWAFFGLVSFALLVRTKRS